MNRLLLSTIDTSGKAYFQFGQRLGLHVRVLDCFKHQHPSLRSEYGARLLTTSATRTDVTKAIVDGGFTAAIVNAGDNSVRAALIIQAMRDAKVPYIVAITSQAKASTAFRRFGAHRTIVADSTTDALRQIQKPRVLRKLTPRARRGDWYMRMKRPWRGSFVALPSRLFVPSLVLT